MVGNTLEEAREVGGGFNTFWGVSRHPTEDKFIVGPNEHKVHMYVMVDESLFFPSTLVGLPRVNKRGELVGVRNDGREGWKPSEIDELIQKKGTIVINQVGNHSTQLLKP